MNTINEIKNSKDEIDVLAKAELLKEYLKSLDVIATGRIDILIREKRIDKKMATTLLNDSSHAYNVINKLISVAKVLWIEDLTIKQLGEDYARVKMEDFTNIVDHRTNAHKRRLESKKGKSQIAIDMIKRAIASGIYADYLLVDSWYSKPVFIETMNELGLQVISRMTNNIKIWNFIGKEKTLDSLYQKFKKLKTIKMGQYGKKIKFEYFSVVVEHKKAGKLKIVFIKTKDNLIPIVSTNLELNDEEIIEIYKRRWDIEQGYKELREHFGFGKEENRIYEALIARITLSFFTYNIVSYINRISNEPKTIGGLFKDLECELHTLAIAMQAFIAIMDEIAKIEEVVNRNEDFTAIIDVLRDVTGKLLGFRCES